MARDPAARWPSVGEFGRLIAETEVEASGEPAPAMRPAAGASALAARYEIGVPLGRGRLGSDVYAAVHRALGVPVAIRTRRRRDERNWSAIRARFLQEARALQVAHPSVLQVRDYGEDGDLLYVVTDLVPGSSLRETLGAGPMPWKRVQPLVAQLADAAAALERRGANITGLSPEIIRLTTEDGAPRVVISTPGILQLGDVLATLEEATLRGGALEPELRYLALEVLTGGAPDTRADVYTIGALAYEMATTGAPPFDAATLPELIGRLMRDEAPDPRAASPSLPEAAAAIIRRCLSREPRERFGNAREFGKAWPAQNSNQNQNQN
jgi:serine/threonine-protein kinase